MNKILSKLIANLGSTDNTLEILKKLALKDNRVKILNFSRNFVC